MQTSATSKLLVSDIASSIDHVPSSYIQPISDRPNLHDVDISSNSIPLIDLQELHGPNRANIIYQFEHACSSYGFFQVTLSLFHFQSRSRLALLEWNILFYCNALSLEFTLFYLKFTLFIRQHTLVVSPIYSLYWKTLIHYCLSCYNMSDIEF